jgi:UDP-glucose 4-epimerase
MMAHYRHACVTGGAGFIGSQLVRVLLNRGVTVTVIDNLSVGRRENLPPQVQLIVGDILDPDALDQALHGADIVFHLAARVAIRSSFDFVVQDTQANFCGTAAVLDGARRSRSVRKIVFTSSMAVYADADTPMAIPETYATRPISPYGISKLAAEQLLHAMCAHVGIDSVALRLFNTYGPGQALSAYVGVVTIFVDKLRRGEAPTVFGDGEQCRDFIHVADVVAGLIASMDADVRGETFNLGTGQSVSVNQVVAHLNRVLGTNLPPVYAPAVEGELRNSVADIAKARNLLGFTPRHRFDTAIAQVVAGMLADAQARTTP